MRAHMDDDPLVAVLRGERLERSEGDALAWDLRAGFGRTFDKLWLRSEGERRDGGLEHAVTEQVMGIDIVALMLRLARDGVTALPDELFRKCPAPQAYAVEARVYAEDPAKDSMPSSGLVTRVSLPEASDTVRVDSWIETGLEVSPHYDPLLAKVIATGATRDEALDTLGSALARTRIDGIVTNVSALRAMTAYAELRSATHSTSTLAERAKAGSGGDPDPRIDVLDPGVLTTVQDLPGRVG